MQATTLFAQVTNETSDLFNESSSPVADIAYFILGALIIMGMYALSSYMLGRIFNKAGVEQWKAWLPIYNTLKTFRLGGYSPWLAFVPFVSIILYLAAHYNIGKNLGKSGWFFLLALFLYPVWLTVLAFDSSVWKSEASNLVPQQNIPQAIPNDREYL